MKNLNFSHCFALKAFPCRDSFFGFKCIFCFCLFASILFFKNFFYIYYVYIDYFYIYYVFICFFAFMLLYKMFLYLFSLELLIIFIFIPMLPLTLVFIYRHDYSVGSGKKWLFSKRFFLFLGRCAQSKYKQLFRQIFP